jgi:hypothetical protein
VTVIATKFTSEMLRSWIEQGLAPVREFAKIREVAYVDLPTGHWPQFTRPADLGRAILAGVASVLPHAIDVDEHGRKEPPLATSETATILGFLEFQRATFRWKCEGLDASGLQATTASSSMTLGGMLKHLTYVEDLWFSDVCTGDPRHRRGTPSTGTPTAIGTGTLPRQTLPSSFRRCGRTPLLVLDHWSRRRWPAAAWSGRLFGSTTGSASDPAFDGSSST